jgi:His-Xaa-Ser repeat protein HxsA
LSKRGFLIPTLLAAGFVPLKLEASVRPEHQPDVVGKVPLLDVFRLPHAFSLAAHSSHSSHSSHASHTSHRSSSGGGIALPVYRAPPPQPSAPLLDLEKRQIFSSPEPSTAPAPPAVRSTDARARSVVAQVQTGLYAYGYYQGPIDGIVGAGTREALRRMQADWNLKVTGTITPEILDALGVVAR